MKKIFLIFAICFGSVSGYSQLVEVNSIKEIPTINAEYALISPSGEYILGTDGSRNGLQKFDLKTGELVTITNAQGAGYDPKILEDGTIIFRETSFKGKLKETSLNSLNPQTKASSLLISPTRDLNGVNIVGNAVYAVKDGKLTTKAMTKTATIEKSTPVMSIQNGQLMMTKNGKTFIFSPNGQNEHYIWPSVSPDGSKVLYYVGGTGAFVCNLDGSNVTPIGKIRAPKWYNSEVVIGMNDKDNGEYTTSSSIIATSIDGATTQTLTDSSVIAMYPSSSMQGDKILFSTPEGKNYIINVNVKK